MLHHPLNARRKLQIPGPTNIPDRVLLAMARPNLNHRGDEFAEVVHRVVAGLEGIFDTTNDILIFPGSGTGGLESSLVNTVSPGDRVLSLVNGVFSDKFAAMAETFGARVERLDFDWGRPVDPAAVRQALAADTEHELHAVLVTHNETSTGVTSDLHAISQARAETGHPALLLVDAISSLGSIELHVDEWNLDVVVSGAQKGLMAPPGLALLSVSERAWQAAERSTTPRWYWDWKPVVQRMAVGQFPYTPAQPLLFALEQSLELFREEGVPQVYRRHQLLADAFRAAVRAMGLELLAASDEYASNSVTAVKMPGGVSYQELSKTLLEEHGVVIGGGLQNLEGKVFRMGHLGSLSGVDMLGIVGALELALSKLGYGVSPGAGVAEAERVLMQ